jgi:adenosylcobinamide-GDP ribazoletransferase
MRGWGDAARLSVGTFTRVPVPAPSRVDRVVAGRSMLLSPVLGLGLAVLGAAVLLAGDALSGSGGAALLTAVLTIAVVAWTTGGLHLDGLVDVADGLASRRPAAEALAIMRRSDIGALGVATLVLVLLLQVSALAVAVAEDRGPMALTLALVTGRMGAVLACTRGVPGARPDGLGAAVAGSVPRPAALAEVVLLVLAAGGWGAVSYPSRWWAPVLAVLVGLLAGGLLARRCVLRLGGVTGDVLGAAVEVATTGSLVAFALSVG